VLTQSDPASGVPLPTAERHLWRDGRLWLLLAATYVVAGKIGLALAFVNPSATAVWPPTGIALAAVLIFGPRVWPGIFLGAFLMNETTAGTLTASLVIAAGNTLEALLGGYLVNRFAGGRSAFTHGRNIFLFVLFAGFVSTSLSAAIGVTTLSSFAFGEWSAYWPTWLTWWLGDVAGVLVVAPALLFWHANPRVNWSQNRWIEAALLFILVAVIGSVIFVRSEYPLGFLCIPLCVWAASRFGQREAATVTCLLSLIAIWGSTHGLGTFGGQSPKDSLLILQAFMVTACIVGFTIGAAVSGQRFAEEQLHLAYQDLELRVRSGASERRLQTIIDAEPACVKLVSSDGLLLDMNRAGLEMIGATTLSQVAGSPVTNLVHPSDRDRFAKMHRAASGGSPGRLEYRVIALNGDERWVESHFVPFDVAPADRDTEPAVLSVTNDVTERKHLEEQLRQGHRMEAVGLLAGGIAHDFNNLLTAIGGYTEFVMATLDESDSRHTDLLEVRKAAERAAILTRQLLAFGRRQVMRSTVLDLNVLVADVHKLLQRTIPEHITFMLDLSPVLDNVRADSSQLQQVLMNLAVNAADAMPQGGALRLATSTVDMDAAGARRRPPMTPGRYVRLVASDTGIGMSPETMARVFEPFFTTKQPGKGTGLGLATVYGIVKQSGGFIWLTSQPHQGTSVEIYLPAVQEPVESALPVSQQVEPIGGTETILLAEDDGGVRRLARDVLRKYGYHVLEARDGDDALSIAKQYDGVIHLLVTDVVMPGLSGRQLVGRLVQVYPDVKILYSSGYSANVTGGAGLELALPLLAKPYALAELLHKVRETLDG